AETEEEIEEHARRLAAGAGCCKRSPRPCPQTRVRAAVMSDIVLYDLPGSPWPRRARNATALEGHDHLVADRSTIAELSVVPRVAMYSLIHLPLDARRHQNVLAWLDRVGTRPSVARSLDVPTLP